MKRVTAQQAEEAAETVRLHYSTSYGWCAACLKEGQKIWWSDCVPWKGAKEVRTRWIDQGTRP